MSSVDLSEGQSVSEGQEESDLESVRYESSPGNPCACLMDDNHLFSKFRSLYHSDNGTTGILRS